MLLPKDTDCLNECKKRPVYMLSTRDSPKTSGNIQTESEGPENKKNHSMQKEIKRKWK